VGGFGESERGTLAFHSDLIVRMRNNGDTAVVRFVTEKSTTTLENGSFLITVTGLQRGSVRCKQR
jgi:hypothetical protein